MRALLLRLRSRGRVEVGAGVRFGRRVRIGAAPGARVVVGDRCRLGDGTRLLARGGELRVGDGCVLGDRCTIVSHAGVDVGAGSRLGQWVTITDVEPVVDDVAVPVREQGVRAAPVRLAPGTIVDHGACVGAGVTVAEGGRVAAHAVLDRDVPPGAVAEGAPVRVHRA